MKILAIRFRNLASFEGSYEIDFTAEPLLTAGIFAISGPTGSGKSTILDALCLALFDKTPRFAATSERITLQDVGDDRIQQNDVRNILRRGAAEGFAEVDFIGVDGFSYSSRWTVYRARRKSTGTLQNQTLAVRNLTTECELQGTKTELLNRLTALLGLTYDQFTRTVLLAQNDFATFLRSRDDAKAELLEKLTGTDIYSRISISVYNHHKEAQFSLNELKLRIGEIVLFSEEEIDELKTVRQQKIAERDEGRTLQQQLDQKIKWYEIYSDLLLSKKKAEELFSAAEENLTLAASRFDLISRIDQVQSARPLVLNKKNLSGSLLSQRQQLEANEKELLKETGILREAKELHVFRKRTLETCLGEIRKITPDLQKARILDVQLKDISKNLSDAEGELRVAIGNREAREKEKCDKDLLLKDTAAQLHLLDTWIGEYHQYESLISKSDYILNLLETANVARQKAGIINAGLLQLDDSLSKARNNLSLQEKYDSENKERLDNCQLKLNESRKKMDSLFIDEVRAEYAKINARREAIQTAYMAWTDLQSVRKNNAALKEKQIVWIEELKRTQELFQQRSSELELVKREKDTVFRLYENSRLSLSADVAELRSFLLPGEPCPVCGNCQHPHAGNDVRINSFFQAIEAEYRQIAIKYDLQNNELIGTAKDVEHLTLRLQELKNELNHSELFLKEKNRDWEERSSGIMHEELDEKETDKWFEQIIRETKERLDFLVGIENAFEAEYKLYKEFKKEEELLFLRDEELKIISKSIEKDIQSISGEYDKKKTLYEQNQLLFNETFAHLNREIPIDNWTERWNRDHHEFTTYLIDLTRLWKDKHDRKQALQFSFQKLTTELEGNSRLLTLAMENENKSRLAYGNIQKTFNRLKDERNLLLGGELADEVESTLRKQQQIAEVNVNHSLKELDILQSKCSTLEGQIVQSQKEINKIEHELFLVDKSLSDWIGNFEYVDSARRITEIELMELLDADIDWIRNERLSLSALQEAKTSFRATLTERDIQLQKHNESLVRPDLEMEKKEDLIVSFSIQQQKNEAVEHVLSDIVTKFVIQQQNKERLKSFEKELNEKQLIATRWAKLNDLIGQANGEKFKIIAQKYTLNILLLHANKHLSYLYPRYELQQVQGTLALQIIDHDMCDEMRTVYSLSGGESFLVSLSLALGLSSLSSSNMRVESLFIDEGFGSLDAESLRMVMEALEQLQTQGRKIGVISHVAEMTERIVAQIVLNKGINGKSKLTVIG